MLFLTYNPQLLPFTEKEITHTLCWYPDYPGELSLAAVIEGETSFLLHTSSTGLMIRFSPPTVREALNGSLSWLGKVRLGFYQILTLYGMAKKYGLAFSQLCLPESIKNEPVFQEAFLKQAKSWPGPLLDWLKIKSLPVKTLRLIGLLSENQRIFLGNYIVRENPSVQNLKQFIETLRDFSECFTAKDYDPQLFKEVTDKRTLPHRQADSLLADIRKNIKVDNPDNYESTTLHWNFSTSNPADFRKILDKMATLEEKVTAFYTLLEPPK